MNRSRTVDFWMAVPKPARKRAIIICGASLSDTPNLCLL
ncbi:predicted protein [Plenodomus lingam JN3]|uniref:Predicted protein n=1 Tax=Leptosphaeria maculans (strain JN3 / isolate v23.1.3 / race Av1-4-5-6-7-8) TaxID=985895 RepID=E4ZY79_LEPMJ|nr:predicted protein [Plenodomus lingam JN3]CBX96324.1 predicted protein [Plenodomus lingam JN3]